jgi:hypothetical protein
MGDTIREDLTTQTGFAAIEIRPRSNHQSKRKGANRSRRLRPLKILWGSARALACPLRRLAEEFLPPSAYFCHVRFLWRLARSCLRRLCLLIFDLRRFFSEPISSVVRSSVNYFI